MSKIINYPLSKYESETYIYLLQNGCSEGNRDAIIIRLIEAIGREETEEERSEKARQAEEERRDAYMNGDY